MLDHYWKKVGGSETGQLVPRSRSVGDRWNEPWWTAATNDGDSRRKRAKSCAEYEHGSRCGRDADEQTDGRTERRDGSKMNGSKCSNNYLSGSIEQDQFNAFVSNHHRRCKQQQQHINGIRRLPTKTAGVPGRPIICNDQRIGEQTDGTRARTAWIIAYSTIRYNCRTPCSKQHATLLPRSIRTHKMQFMRLVWSGCACC